MQQETLPVRPLRRALLVLKETCIMRIERSDNSQDRLEQLKRSMDSLEAIRRSNREHNRTVSIVARALKARRIAFDSVEWSALPGKRLDDYDLVISIGGDGTFLLASHHITSVPVLGVRSSASSHGHFCLADARNFKAVLGDILSGVRLPQKLLRLELVLDGQVLPCRVLNEVLVHDATPPGASRWWLSINGRRERQLSTGMYIATPAGSTGSIRSAGGVVLPITSRQFQYWVREPFMAPGSPLKLIDGLLGENDEFVLTSETWDGKLFVDGRHSQIVFDFPRGARLVVRPAAQDLPVYIEPAINEAYTRIVRR